MDVYGAMNVNAFISVTLFLFAAMGYVHIARKIRDLHLSTNSRLDELLTTTKALSRAEGFKAGQEDEQAKRFKEIAKAGESLDREE